MSMPTLLVLSLLQSPTPPSEAQPSEAQPSATERAKTEEAKPAEPRGVMQPPAWVPHDSPEGQLWLEGTSKVLMEHLSSHDRRRLGTKVLSPARVSLAKGTFPNQGDVLVTVNVELRLSEPEATPQTIAGMFTLTREGALASMVVAPKMRAARFEVRAIGHHDDDGRHDFEYDEITDGTLVRHRVTWVEGEPRDETLSSTPTPAPPSPAE